MENYTKGKNVEEELERSKIPIKDLPENFLWMQVGYSAILNSKKIYCRHLINASMTL